MPQQKGSTSKVMIGIENSAYGTVATTGFVLPVEPGINIAGSQSINTSETLHGGRNPLQPWRGFRDVRGQVTVPIDSVCLPYWLIAMFGDPASSGTGPYEHEWKVPSAQPSFSLEEAFTDLTTDRYQRFVGCKIGGFSLSIGGDGALLITFDIVGSEDSWETSAFDASPTTPTESRVDNDENAVIEEGGSSSSIITELGINVDLGLDTRTELITIGSNSRQSLPEGVIGITGNIKALFDDAGYTLHNKGIAKTESSLKYTATASASSIFEIELQEVEYDRTGIELESMGGLFVNMNLNGFYNNGSETSAVVLRITNSTESYDIVT